MRTILAAALLASLALPAASANPIEGPAERVALAVEKQLGRAGDACGQLAAHEGSGRVAHLCWSLGELSAIVPAYARFLATQWPA